MKKYLAALIVTLFLGFSLVAAAEVFKYNKNDWEVFGSNKENNIELLLQKQSIVVDGQKHVFVMTHFLDQPTKKFSVSPTVRRVISEAVVNCEQAFITHVKDTQTDENFTVLNVVTYPINYPAIFVEKDEKTIAGIMYRRACKK